MSKECNTMGCLRKFRENATSDISRWCGIYGREKESKLIHNSKECPYFCDKFYDYELKKIIDKHEEVHWISEEKDTSWDKHSNGLSVGLFTGISREGSEKQDKRQEWENEHINCDKIVCPYCDYEFEHGDDDYTYEDMEEEKECPDCGKKFNCVTNVSYSWSTSKLEEYEED